MPNLLTKEFVKISKADIDGSSWTTATGTYTSDAIRPHFRSGACTLLVLTSAGSLTITYQVSNNGSVWYEPYSTGGDKVNTIVNGLSGDRWISFTPVICEYMRFVGVLADNDSTVSLIYQQQERK